MTSDVADGPLIVDVSTEERVNSYGVGLAVTYEEGQVLSAETSGTLTGLSASAGDVLEAGDEVLRIDDLPVIAFLSDAPLWRDLSLGLRGDDVSRLQQYLTQLTYYSGPVDGVYGSGTASAVQRFNRDHGRAAGGTTFELRSVIWVGQAGFSIGSIDIAIGDSVAPGDQIIRGPRVARLGVTEPPGGLASSTGYELIVSDLRVPYEAGSGTIVDNEVVAAVAGVLGTSAEGAGQIVSTDVIPVRRVPASAVVVDDAGGICVFSGLGEPPTAVTLIGGTVAHADLSDDTTIDEVLVNPLQVMEEPSCDSSSNR